jgi:hypothetical protein
MGFGLILGFIERLWLINTNYFNTFNNLHTLQITIAHAKPWSAIVFTGHC